MTTYSVIFKSGAAGEFRYENEGNIDFVNITNTDQTYYQTAEIGLHDLGTNSLNINDKIRVVINDKIQFDGYANRVQRSLSGTDVWKVEGIGKTYNLWRFVTSSTTEYINRYTSYIVSSLVRTYCTGNSYYTYPPFIGPTSGAFIDYVNFQDMEIGACVGRMAQMDGYTFYVSSNGQLIYYNPEETSQFTIEESDILDMSPYELSDDSMRNSVLVLGAEEYELFSETPSSLNYYFISGPSTDTGVGATGDSKYYAQAIIVPDDLHNNWLSSVELYLSRSSGANIPYYLKGELRRDKDGLPSSMAIPSSESMYFAGSDLLNPPNWTEYYSYNSPESFPITGGQKVWMVFHYDGASPSKYWKLYYNTFIPMQYGLPNNTMDQDPVFTNTWDYGGQGYGQVGYDATADHIYFCVSSIGYAAAGTFDNNYSRVYREFGMTGARTTDLVSFSISANFKKYMSGGTASGSLATNDYNKYQPRLMIGVSDPTAPGGNDYNPMMGFEFSMGCFNGEDVIDCNYDDSDDYYWWGYGSQPAQIFNSGALPLDEGMKFIATKARLLLHYNGPNPDTEYVYCCLWPVANGVPYEPCLASGMIHANLIVGGTYTTFNFNKHVCLNSGNNYAVGITYTDKDTQAVIGIGTAEPSTYTRGYGAYQGTDAQPWSNEGMGNYKFCFEICGSYYRAVRPFLCKNITTSNPTNTEYTHGNWYRTGATSYKCELNGTNLLFYVDRNLKQTWNIASVTLDGNYKFGAGHIYNWSSFRIQMIDTGYSTLGSKSYLFSITGNIKYINLAGSAESMSYSTDSGQTWTSLPDNYLSYSIGWNYDNVRGFAEDQSSITNYGTHFYKVSEDLITSYTDADNYASRLTDTYANGIAKGDLEINGRTDITLLSKFNLSSSHLNINEDMNISQYNQIIDKNGFRTKISYGEAPYDIARKVANLESSVYT